MGVDKLGPWPQRRPVAIWLEQSPDGLYIRDANGHRLLWINHDTLVHVDPRAFRHGSVQPTTPTKEGGS